MHVCWLSWLVEFHVHNHFGLQILLAACNAGLSIINVFKVSPNVSVSVSTLFQHSDHTSHVHLVLQGLHTCMLCNGILRCHVSIKDLLCIIWWVHARHTGIQFVSEIWHTHQSDTDASRTTLRRFKLMEETHRNPTSRSISLSTYPQRPQLGAQARLPWSSPTLHRSLSSASSVVIFLRVEPCSCPIKAQ